MIVIELVAIKLFDNQVLKYFIFYNLKYQQGLFY